MTRLTPSDPVRFTPVGPDTPQDAFAKAVANELAIDGLDAGSALPVAIGLLSAVQTALNTGDLAAGVALLRLTRTHSDLWWVEHHPRSKRAAAARLRLGLPG